MNQAMEELSLSPNQPMVLLLLLFCLTTFLIFRRTFYAHPESSKKNKKARAPTYPPELRPYPLVGHLPQFLANRHRMLDWMADMLAAHPTNTLVFHRPGGVRGIITANPANVEHFLHTHSDNYPKGARFSSMLHDFLGHGIFNSDGVSWRVQRKTASFEFNTRSLRGFIVHCIQHELHDRLLPLLRCAAASCQVLDLQDIFERFAFDNICRVAFDLDPHQLLDKPVEDKTTISQLDEHHYAAASNFATAFRDAANLSAGRFRYAVPRWWKVKKTLNIGSERCLRESIATVHDFAEQIIHSRREEIVGGHEKHDLLSRFMAKKDESYSEEFVRDIVISFLLAGRDTTSSALVWFFWVLSSRPDVEHRILEEIASVRARGRGSNNVGFVLEELREMHYLHAAITESMRLYPPVPVNSTEALADDELPDGTVVGKGWFMSYNAYAMGRMEAVWGKDAAEFRPERWLDQADGTFRPESPYRFVAFHAGPRMCLGKEMAYIQMKSVVACVLEGFAMRIDGAFQPQKVMSLTLRMQDGLPVRVKERKQQE